VARPLCCLLFLCCLPPHRLPHPLSSFQPSTPWTSTLYPASIFLQQQSGVPVGRGRRCTVLVFESPVHRTGKKPKPSRTELQFG
jgi:hypothetical protein